MRILILEDDSFRITTFIEKFCDYDLVITETSKEAIHRIDTEIFDYIFLDHDLGYHNGTGYDVALHLSDNPQNPNNKALIIIHSWNTPAVQSMVGLLYNAKVIPFNTADFFAITLDK
jgi:CheY-like chemotaxis protein